MQSGGANRGNGGLFLGNNAGSNGTYGVSGGLLSIYSQYVGYSGTGSFTQTGGTNNANGNSDLYLGSNAGSSGAYFLGNGLLSEGIEYVGALGMGTFTQSGGTNTVSGSLYLGNSAGGVGVYILSGTSQLSADGEYVGFASGATATFQQTSGTNSTWLMSIGSDGSYLLAGGLLQVSYGLTNQGTFSGGTAAAALSASNILDLTSGTWHNLNSISLSMGTNSLLVVPPGFNPATAFAAYSSLGLTHTLGTTLTVPAGNGFGGWGSINDPVVCQGTIAATGAGINLNAGLLLSGTGVVQLGNGTLTNNDLISAINGGTFSAAYQYVGSGGTGTFTQSAGTNTVGNALYLGNGAGDSGSYNLVSGYCSAFSEYVGFSGTGSFTQLGGTNTGSYLSLDIGYGTSSSGGYSLKRQRPVVGVLRDYWRLRHGQLDSVGRNERQQLSLSWRQQRQQRRVWPQWQQPPVGLLRVLGVFGHGDLHAVERDQ